jgi:hypothetical protein
MEFNNAKKVYRKSGGKALHSLSPWRILNLW